MPKPYWIAGTCLPPDERNEIRRKPSDGLSSCPTVFELGDEVVLQGYELDDETRRMLNIPEGENAVRMPKDVYVRGADVLTGRRG